MSHENIPKILQRLRAGKPPERPPLTEQERKDLANWLADLCETEDGQKALDALLYVLPMKDDGEN